MLHTHLTYAVLLSITFCSEHFSITLKLIIISNACCVCVKRITLCNYLCSSCSPSSSSHDFRSVIRNIGKFGAKNYFKDHQKGNTNYHFRDSVHVLKIYGRWDTQKFEQPPISIQAIATYKTRIVCWCKQPTSNTFETLQTVNNYSNCMINQLLYCWGMF